MQFESDSANPFAEVALDNPRGRNLIETALIVLMLAAMALLLYLVSGPEQGKTLF